MSAGQAYAEAVCTDGQVFDVLLELTYRCFEKCIHCYNPGATRNDTEQNGRGNIEELTWDDYKRIIDDLCANGLVMATITGGDPFMHPSGNHRYGTEAAFTVASFFIKQIGAPSSSHSQHHRRFNVQFKAEVSRELV